MVTMLLGGIWHGAAWTFVWWGAYHGALLGLHRLLRHRLARIQFRGFHWICGIVMFHLTCAGWLLFRAQGMEQVGYWCEAVFKRWSVAPENGWIVLRHLALYAGPVVCIQILQARRGEADRITALPRPLRLAIIAVIYLLFLCLGEFGRRTFIYFQF
jgi:alginate O-acetyltransferase complex protein AlgI